MDEKMFKENVEVGKWQRFDNFCCKHCPFSTLHKNIMVEHLITRHFLPEPAKTVLVQAYDRWGKPVGPAPGETEEVTAVVEVTPETTIEEVLEKMDVVESEKKSSKGRKSKKED